MSLNRMAHGLKGRVVLSGTSRLLDRVHTDTRTLEKGQVFLALKGERFDGHRFFEAAIKRKAAALVGESFSNAVKDLARSKNTGLIQVKDSLAALQSLAKDQRMLFDFPVVGVTGSNGKTGTKNCLAYLLGAEGPVLATQGNLNNHIGLPLTLLKARPGMRAAVLEMGVNHPGELKALAALARPQVGVVTTVGDAHLGYFKTRAQVARAKAELAESLGSCGLAVLNADDPLVRGMARRHQGASLFYGRAAGSHLRLLRVRDRGHWGAGLELEWNPGCLGCREKFSLSLDRGGEAFLNNALAALATAIGLGLDIAEMGRRLETYVPRAAMRLETRPLGPATALLDCYNANPQSMQAALDYLRISAGPGGLAALGDMLELGPRSAELHRELGRQARKAGIRALAAVGNYSRQVAEGFGGEARAFGPDGHKLAAGWLKLWMQKGDWVLFKGSRGMKMELVYEYLKNTLG